MTYEILEKKIEKLPNECIEDIVNYIDYICFKYDQKRNLKLKKLEALKAVFGCIDDEQAEVLRSCNERNRRKY